MISLNDDEIKEIILALEEGVYYDANYKIIHSAILMIKEKVKENE